MTVAAPRDVQQSMRTLMNPRSIAIVGASQRAARGTRVVQNLLDAEFDGAVYPINPKYDQVLGVRCYPSVTATPHPADCVVVAIPAQHVANLLEEAFEAGIPSAVVLSGGFGEAGQIGRERHQRLSDLASRGMAICGPNCYGLLNLHTRAAAFSGDLPDPILPGSVALVSQSGGFTNEIAQPLIEMRGLGFSYFVSCGNQAGVAVEDYLGFLLEDENTRVIAGFIEGFRKPLALRELGRRSVELGKPIVVLKVGRTDGARQSTLAHTGSLAGSADVIDALLRQSGIVQVSTMNQLIETTYLFGAAGERRSGWRVGVLTGSGGESGYVSDAAEAAGLTLPPLADTTIDAVEQILPEFAQPRNPLDGTGAMFEDPTVFPRLIRRLADDPNVDTLAVNLGARPRSRRPNHPFDAFVLDMAQVAATTERLIVAYSTAVGGPHKESVTGPLIRAGIPYLEGTEFAMRALSDLNRFRDRCAVGLQARSAPAPEVELPADLPPRGTLTFTQAQSLLERFGIPTVPTRLARTAQEAVAVAGEVGYPVALKVEAAAVAHKTDVGAVRLDCATPAAVRQAFREIIAAARSSNPEANVLGALVQPMLGDAVEVIVGVKTDPLVGPAVLCGLGGIYTEILRDVAVGIPPLTPGEAHALLGQLRGSPVLRGARGRPPADVAALTAVLVRVGDLAVQLGDRLGGLDLNPVMVLPEGRGALVVDALVELV
jgi:acetyltransferase